MAHKGSREELLDQFLMIISTKALQEQAHLRGDRRLVRELGRDLIEGRRVIAEIRANLR